MAMVPPRSLPKFGAFGAIEKCLWFLSMIFGDNDNAMGVWSIASSSTAKSQVQSLCIHGYGLPGVSTQNWSFWRNGKVSLVYIHEIW